MKRTHPAIAIALTLALSNVAEARQYGPWNDPQPVNTINTVMAAEGCPIESRDGLSLYIASNRGAVGAQGKLDVYRAQRDAIGADWGEPQNLGPVVNTPEFDYCPTPLQGRWLMFVTSQATAGDCFPGEAAPSAPPGSPAPGDIYLTRENPAHGWTQPLNLGCFPHGPNTPRYEFSPSLVETAEGTWLFFSSNGYPDSQGHDIYVSRVLDDGTVTPGQRVAELSTAYDDRMPNVSKDGREIVFSSTRPGTAGSHDIYVSTRSDTGATWAAPERIDNPFINTAASETRASLSGDGSRLYFGRKLDASDPGDIFVSTRDKLTGKRAR